MRPDDSAPSGSPAARVPILCESIVLWTVVTDGTSVPSTFRRRSAIWAWFECTRSKQWASFSSRNERHSASWNWLLDMNASLERPR